MTLVRHFLEFAWRVLFVALASRDFFCFTPVYWLSRCPADGGRLRAEGVPAQDGAGVCRAESQQQLQECAARRETTRDTAVQLEYCIPDRYDDAVQEYY